MPDGTTSSATLPGVLGREDLLARIHGEPSLLTDWADLAEQVQPNGIDLSLRSVARITGAGVLAADNAGRRLPDYEEIPFDAGGFVDLPPGVYQVVYNEIVDLPNDLMALGRPRSSLCRCGVTLHTAVWDAGYRGRSTSLLSVLNPEGFRVQRGARLLQLVFFGLARPAAEGYRGVYRDEHTTT